MTTPLIIGQCGVCTAINQHEPNCPIGQGTHFQAKELPHIACPGWLNTLGFKDHSWRQDLAARFTWVPPHEELSNDTPVQVWIAPHRKEDREWATQPRYLVAIGTEDDGSAGLSLYYGEDEQKAYATAELIIRLANDPAKGVTPLV